MTQPPPVPPSTKARRRGCLFYGCGVVILCGLLTLAGLLAGAWQAKKMIDRFTDRSPTPLPKVELPATEAAALRQRVEAFQNKVKSAQAREPLILNTEELNTLIATDQNFQQLKGRVYLKIDANKISGKMSFPMEQLGLPIFHGRYLNADGVFNLSLQNGTLRLTAEELSVKGKPVPDKYMAQIRSENLVRDINQDPHKSAGLNLLKSIEVKDGKVIIVPQGNP
jgi:hypothetical protein